MKIWLSTVLNIAKIDLLQKIRSKNTLAIIVFFMLFTFFCFPDRNSRINFSISLRRDDILSARGFYNSDWISVLIVVYFTTVLLFIGIFFIRKTIRREQLDGYGMLLASSNVNKSAFFEGKRLSNFLYLAGIMAIVEGLGIVIQILRSESHTINIASYIFSYLVIILPFVYLLATIAIIFEVIPFLKGSLGNFFIFILAMFSTLSSLTTLQYSKNSNIFIDTLDFSGFRYCLEQVRESFVFNYGGSLPGFVVFGTSPPYTNFFTFHFKWEPMFIITRVILIILTFSLLYFVQWLTPLSSIFVTKTGHKLKKNSKPDPITSDFQPTYFTLDLQIRNKISVKNISFLRLFYFQTLSAIREKPIIHFTIAVSFIVQWLPLSASFNQNILIIATILPISIWAQIGLKKEEDYLKTTIAYPSHIVWSTLLINWIVWLIYFSGTISKSLQLHNLTGASTVIISSLFIVSFAYASNSIFHSELLFEMVFMFVWYIEIVQKAKLINLFDAHSLSIDSLIFLFIAWIGCTILGVVSKKLITFDSKV